MIERVYGDGLGEAVIDAREDEDQDDPKYDHSGSSNICCSDS